MYKVINSRAEVAIFSLFFLITLTSFFIGIYSTIYYFFLLPFAILFIYFCFTDFKKIYLLLILLLPITSEVKLPNGFATDIPAEPIMVFLMFIYFFYITSKKEWDTTFIKHPITQILILHLLWIIITIIFSNSLLISIKFFLAKLWYVTIFFFLTGSLIKNIKNYKTIFWCILIPLLFTIFSALIKHAFFNFSFDEINRALQPFYRNHVSYATLLSLFLPFVWIAKNWYPPKSFLHIFLIACRFLILIALFFSYARGAWLALVVALICYFLIKKKLHKQVLLSLITLLIIGSIYFIKNNNYLKYAPDFTTTIYHRNIKDHLEATKELKDVSSAERIYRWIAAIRMSKDYPITGVGPNNFYHFYKRYTVTSFTTYVSDNPEKSGVHNYFLMMLIEQGIVGLLIFLLLSYSIFYYGIKTYYHAVEPQKKQFITAILLSLIIIYVQLLLSDLLEAVKIGTLFFMNIALIVNLNLQENKQLNKT